MSTTTVSMLIVLSFGVALTVAVMMARVAISKQRDPVFWFLFAFGNPILAPLILLLIRHRQKVRHADRVRWYEHPAARAAMRFIASLSLPGAVWQLTTWFADNPQQWYLPAFGLFVTAWAFVGATALARLLLSTDHPPIAVARVVLDEALHSRVAVGFIAVLLLALALLVAIFSGDVDQPLRYRVQAFISWSYIVLGIMLGLLTILFSCWTLSSEIQMQRIFTVAVKPIGRASYIFGKWLGIITLDALLLLVSGAAIYCFTVFYLANLAPLNRYDGDALHDEILTARVAVDPVPEIPLTVEASQIVAEMPETQLRAMGNDVAERERLIGLQPDQILALGRERAVRQTTLFVATRWLTVAAGESKTFHFSGLGPLIDDWNRDVESWRTASDIAEVNGQRPPPPPRSRYFQLRYEVKTTAMLPDGLVDLEMKINNRNLQPDARKQNFTLVINTPQIISVPVAFINDDGTIALQVSSPRELGNPPLTFAPERGLEIMFSAGSFEGNFVRALLAMWVKLAFLAMLGIAAATFLGFPVACLLATLVALAATASPYLLESAETFSIDDESLALDAVETSVRSITYYLALGLGKFAEYEVGDKIATGRLFSWSQLVACMLWIGGAWIGVVAVVGAVVFHRRELARIQV